MSPEFIFVMKDLRKVVPPNREILKGIWLSFFFGAKIGVIGANGAGKSSLLRIMAGEDPSFLGEAFPAKSIKVGLLPQEPKLDSPLNASIFRTTLQHASWTTSSASCWSPVMLVARRYARSPYVTTRRSAAAGSRSRSAWTRSRSRSARGARVTVRISGSRTMARLISSPSTRIDLLSG